MTAGVSYYYVVSANYSGGLSMDSAEVSALPSAAPVHQTITFNLGLAVTKTAIELPFADVATATSGLP